MATVSGGALGCPVSGEQVLPGPFSRAELPLLVPPPVRGQWAVQAQGPRASPGLGDAE